MLDHIGYVIVFVSDMARSIGFYRDALGLKLQSESESWSEFEIGATTLALHGGGVASGPLPEDAAKRAGTCSLEFMVADIAEAAAELESRGVEFAMPPTPRENEGVIRAVCTDPDGLRISVAQPLGSA